MTSATDRGLNDELGSPWLYGPQKDLLFGAGVAYLISVPLILLLPSAREASSWPESIVWIIAIGINGAHYGGTLLRVYEEREERRKYSFFSIWLTLALAGAFIVGVYDIWVGSLLVTLYLTWSPWHFAGQNYGIALMFLRRRGVEVEAHAKRLLYTSFVLSFLLAFLALHTEGATNVYAPTRTSTGPVLDLLRIGIPQSIALPLALGLAALYLGSLVTALVLLGRSAGGRALVPVMSLVSCQALWFVLPALHDTFDTGTGRGLAFAAIWVSAAHSLQYLWVTLYYYRARANRVSSQSDGASSLSYLAKTLLAGNAAFVIPGVLFSGALLGTRSWDAGLGVLIFSVVNLHHFFLDGAIWKLRDGAIARALLRRSEAPGNPVEGQKSSGRRLAALLFWTVGVACLTLEVGELVRKQAERTGATALAGRVLDGMALLGRDHEGARIRLGKTAMKQRDFANAQHQFEQSIRARPTIAGYAGMGRAQEARGDLRSAAKSYEIALGLAPEDAALLRSAGRARFKLGEPERAAPLLKLALEIEPDNVGAQRALESSRRAIRKSAEGPLLPDHGASP